MIGYCEFGYANVIGMLVARVVFPLQFDPRDGSFRIYRVQVAQTVVDVMAPALACYFHTWNFDTKQRHVMMMAHHMEFALEYSLNRLVRRLHSEKHIWTLALLFCYIFGVHAICFFINFFLIFISIFRILPLFREHHFPFAFWFNRLFLNT